VRHVEGRYAADALVETSTTAASADPAALSSMTQGELWEHFSALRPYQGMQLHHELGGIRYLSIREGIRLGLDLGSGLGSACALGFERSRRER
jgi:hypothetical protein